MSAVVADTTENQVDLVVERKGSEVALTSALVEQDGRKMIGFRLP